MRRKRTTFVIRNAPIDRGIIFQVYNVRCQLLVPVSARASAADNFEASITGRAVCNGNDSAARSLLHSAYVT